MLAASDQGKQQQHQNSKQQPLITSGMSELCDHDGVQHRNLLSNVDVYTIADVYEDAAIIGGELEKIISNYGSHVLKDLMPKVIGVLELLEQLTLRKEKETEQLNECRVKISSLEMDKMQRFNEREKFEKVG